MRTRDKRRTTRQLLSIGAITSTLGLAGGLVAPTAASASNSVTITYWSWNPGTVIMTEQAKAFEKLNPNVTVDVSAPTYDDYLVALKAAANAGKMPTVFGAQEGGMARQYQPYSVSLGPLATKSLGSNWKAGFLPAGLSAAQVGNTPGNTNFYYLPESLQSTAMLINTAWFTKLKVPVPTTFQQMIADAKVFNANNQPLMVVGGEDGWQNEDVFLQFANQTAPGQFYSAEASGKGFTSPGLVSAMTYFKDLFTDHIVEKDELGAVYYPTLANTFQTQGTGGMSPLGSWTLSAALKSASPPDPLTKAWTYVPFPKLCSTCKPVPLTGADVIVGLGNTSTGAVQAAGWKFLQFLTQGGGETIYADQLIDLPSKTGLIPTGPLSDLYLPNGIALFNHFEALANEGTPRYVVNPNLNTALITALANVASGQKSPEAALASLNGIS